MTRPPPIAAPPPAALPTLVWVAALAIAASLPRAAAAQAPGMSPPAPQPPAVQNPSGPASGAVGTPVLPTTEPLHAPVPPPSRTETKIQGTTPVEVGPPLAGQPPQPPAAAPLPPPPPPPPPDSMAAAGYIAGYRTYQAIGASPFMPLSGALPGAVTPAFATPMPGGSDWTFRFNGFLSASAQYSVNQRQGALAPGQALTVFHSPPSTVDEYQSFVGTNTMPGQWVALNFSYGKKLVSANLSLSTWNPSEPTTYYQLGSQGFVNNAFLRFELPRAGALSVGASAGYFINYYGNLGQYGGGLYQNPTVGGPRGVGVTLNADYSLTQELTLRLEGGIMGNRNGKVASCPNPQLPGTPNDGGLDAGCTVTPAAGGNNGANPMWPAAFTHHLHAGLVRKGPSTIAAHLHYIVNWAADERTQLPTDNEVTREIDESYVQDGRISVYGAQVTVSNPIYGWFSAGGSYVKGEHAFPLKGLLTFGGDGESLTQRWWGASSGGTGTLAVLAVNYQVSLGKVVSAPVPFNGDGPDLVATLGGVVAVSHADDPAFDGRVRHKFGGDFLYTFLPFMGAGLRLDRVVPSSHDAAQTFHVAAARLVFKTNWRSRESLMLLYARWFYGPNTHPEHSSTVRPWLDDQMIALNVNMWW